MIGDYALIKNKISQLISIIVMNENMQPEHDSEKSVCKTDTKVDF